MGIYIDENAKGYPEHYAEQGPKFGRMDWFMNNTTLSLDAFDIGFEKLKEEKKVLLILLDNGNFCAIAVAYCKEEFECFQQNFQNQEDKRVKFPATIDYEELCNVKPELSEIMKWD